MKILLTNFHDGDGGGHTTYLTQLAAGLSGRHDVHVAAPAPSRLLREAQEIPGVTTWAQSFPNGLDRIVERERAKSALSARISEHAYDVIHVNGSADHRLTLAALSRVQRKRTAVVFTKHNSKSLQGIGNAWRARHGTDGVIAVCEHTRRQLQHSPYRKLPLYAVHNGVNTRHFVPWTNDAARSVREAWADEQQLLLGSIAGTAEYKGWFDLAQALALLSPERRDQVRVVIAGTPPTQKRLDQLQALSVAHCFHFPGLLRDVRGIAAAIDAGFVLSHDVETISFACREMMSMGKPVMVTDYAGLPENINHGQDGWIVPVHGHGEMARVLEDMLADRSRLSAMGTAARARAVNDFDIQQFIDKTEAVYLDLVDGTAHEAERPDRRLHPDIELPRQR
jgi:glycosyltransferase involved in cell wall biosynthesis